jgi:lipoate-protein ligase A
MGPAPASPITVNLLASSCLSGCWQMALDGALLQRQRPALRLYRWSHLTMSLGFHQQHLEPQWLDWHRRGQLDLVRRPSGGGAVLHGGDLCYALVLPCDRFNRVQAYTRICSWLQQSLGSLGEPLQFGNEQADGNPNCFARSTTADLVNADGIKRVGNAQRWQRGWLLQHGSIQLDPPSDAWQALLPGSPHQAGLAVNARDLTDRLLSTARQHWRLPARARPLDSGLLAAAGNNLECYRVPSAESPEVTSPLACIARTT